MPGICIDENSFHVCVFKEREKKSFVPGFSWLFKAGLLSFLEGVNSFPAQGTLYGVSDRAFPIYFCDVT